MQCIAASLLCCAVTVSLVLGQDTCTVNDVNRCVDAFVLQYGKQDLASFFTKNRDAEGMNLLCIDFHKMKLCTETFMPHCDTATKTLFMSLFNSVDYMCGSGLQVYLKHRRCFTQPDMLEKTTACNKTAAESFSHIQSQLYSYRVTHLYSHSEVEKLKTQLCRTTDKVLTCVKDVAEAHCGKEAADFSYTLTYKVVEPMMDEVGCNDSKGYIVWYVVAVAGALLSTALVGWCVGMWVQRRRHHHYRDQVALVADQGDWDSTPPPPPVYRPPATSTTSMPATHHPAAGNMTHLPPGAENLTSAPLVNIYNSGSNAFV